MRSALLLACVLAFTLDATASPPDEDVLRPHIPSEGQLYIEPHLGLNFSFLSADSLRPSDPSEGDLDIYRSAFGIAPLIGVTFGYQFSPTIGVEFDVAYDGRSASNSGTSSDACFIIDLSTGDTIEFPRIPIDKDYTVSVDYLSFGFLGTFNVESAFFFLGPSVSIPVASSLDETKHIADDATVCRFFPFTADSTTTISGALNSLEAATHVSLRIGVGGRLRVSDRMELIPRIAYDFGLTDTFTGSGGIRYQKAGTTDGMFYDLPTDKSMQLNALQLSLGLRVTL